MQYYVKIIAKGKNDFKPANTHPTKRQFAKTIVLLRATKTNKKAYG